jgi:2-methylaconitate cis-trans-isomerase PrpF
MDIKLHLAMGILGAFAVTAIAAGGPAEARAIKAKAKPKPVAASHSANRVASRVSRDGWDAFPGNPGHRDRTTYYHPNGRLNGQELFDSIADKAANGGD